MVSAEMRRTIDAEALYDLYVVAGLTTRQVAVRLGCGATTICRRLRSSGIALRRRGPPAGSYRPRGGPTLWSAGVAYAVGVIATDGCLGRDGRTLNVTSKDVELLEATRRCLGLDVAIRRRAASKATPYYQIQWSDPAFHGWLCEIGLMPAKSRCLGPLRVPDDYFRDFLRGCVDGDGCITVYTDRWHAPRNPAYIYERLYLSLISGSPPFLRWIDGTITRLLGVRGTFWTRRKDGCATLRYAKKKSRALVDWMYYAPSVPCLTRKRAVAERFYGDVVANDAPRA